MAKFVEAYKELNKNLAVINANKSFSGIDLLYLKDYLNALDKTTEYASCIAQDILAHTKTFHDYNEVLCLMGKVKVAIDTLIKESNNITEKLMPFSGQCYPHEVYIFLSNYLEDQIEPLDELSDYISQVSHIYNKVINANSDKLLLCIRELQKLYMLNQELSNKFIDFVVNDYYDFLEEKVDEISEHLFDLLYNKRIVEDFSANPNRHHWGKLLSDKLEELKSQKFYEIFESIYSNRKAINIGDKRVVEYVYKNSMKEEEMLLFFRLFAEIAILQEKTRSEIEMIRRPEPEEEPIVLPSMVVEPIRNSQYLSKQFRNGICSVAKFTGKASSKTKWSHVKMTLEHKGLISETNPSMFGRQIHEICPDVNADQCRQNVGNNELKILAGTKYYQLPDTSNVKIQCDLVASEFAEVITELTKL